MQYSFLAHFFSLPSPPTVIVLGVGRPKGKMGYDTGEGIEMRGEI